MQITTPFSVVPLLRKGCVSVASMSAAEQNAISTEILERIKHKQRWSSVVWMATLMLVVIAILVVNNILGDIAAFEDRRLLRFLLAILLLIALVKGARHLSVALRRQSTRVLISACCDALCARKIPYELQTLSTAADTFYSAEADVSRFVRFHQLCTLVLWVLLLFTRGGVRIADGYFARFQECAVYMFFLSGWCAVMLFLVALLFSFSGKLRESQRLTALMAQVVLMTWYGLQINIVLLGCIYLFSLL